MFKSIVLTALLATSSVALACGGKACDHCDKPSTAKVEDITKAAGTHAMFDVSGMKCGACSTKVTNALKALDGVTAVSVNHETGKAEVAFDSKKTNTDSMIAEIKKLDFEAKLAPAEKG